MDTEVAVRRPTAPAASKATRLLCAGTYLDPGFAEAVRTELVDNFDRIVAPSYGYDAVPVVAHALAARSLRNQRVGAVIAGTCVIAGLTAKGVIDPFFALLLFLWLLWASAYLRRLAMLETLITRLRVPPSPGTRNRVYPRHPLLTPDLVEKISIEQSAIDTVVSYGGYYPFVGAGARVDSWTMAIVLKGLPINPLIEDEPPNARHGPASERMARKRREFTRFTVAQLADHIQESLVKTLRENPPETERIRLLSVDLRHYGKVDPGTLPEEATIGDGETYGSARAYICVKIGSWDEELVTTMFAGIDLKGDTLYSEFYVHVLAPISAAFHAIDRMPAALDPGLVAKAAMHTFADAVATVFGKVTRSDRSLKHKPVRRGKWRSRAGEGLARYAEETIDRGARMSIRELAASTQYHHFFQQVDADKYKKIVERRLLETIRTFLQDHNVDLEDLDARQTNILNRYENVTNNGGNLSLGNQGVQSVGDSSSASGRNGSEAKR